MVKIESCFQFFFLQMYILEIFIQAFMNIYFITFDKWNFFYHLKNDTILINLCNNIMSANKTIL
jgi:hypothetical protein